MKASSRGKRSAGSPRASSASLREQIEVRDAFLARVAEGLEGRVALLNEALSRKRRSEALQDALDAIGGFSHELSLIARPVAVATGPRIDLTEVVQRVMASKQAQSRKLGRALVFPATGPVYVSCEAADLETVLLELVSNCIKYGKGPVTVRVSATPTHAQLAVHDAGRGISAADWGRVTGRFVRGRGRSAPGFGVGLWLVRKIARGHGGDLKRSGNGVRVTLRRRRP